MTACKNGRKLGWEQRGKWRLKATLDLGFGIITALSHTLENYLASTTYYITRHSENHRFKNHIMACAS